MTPNQFRDHVARLGLTVYAVGPTLGISRQAAYRYAEGRNKVPEPVAKLLRLMIRLGLKPEDVK